MNLRTLLPALLATALHAQTKPTPAPKAPPEPALEWHDVTTWGLEGRGWNDAPRTRWFQRLPDEAQGKVTAAVWGLSQDSAGMMSRFKTDATTIWTRYTLRKPDAQIAMPHMPATGVSGVDLYGRDRSGKWRWVNVTRPTGKDVKQALATDLAPGLREYAAYLPLYNGIEKLEIGVPPGAQFEGLAPREKPIVFYGTSITHGACASRPGMVHTAILGRRLFRPVINLGFSGNGKMAPEVGEFLVKLDAAAFVIDCLPNMNAAEVRARTGMLVHQLRTAHPETPIILVEDRRNTNSWILPARDKHHTDNHAALAKSFAELKKEGVENLHYIDGDRLLGDDSEGATDGSHPNDLGFMRQSDVFEPVLRKVLGK
ncbi:MAG: SGNH/GDSL hydrolase family protein [Chthoniobacteraceae bacterium]